MQNLNYKFYNKSPQDDMIYNPPENKFKYYQLCSFRNPWNNKHHIRRFVMNSKNEFISIDENYIESRQFKRFVKSHKLNEYKLFNTYDLNHVSYPSMGEITIIQSPILEVNSDYTGYAKF